jgi:hypothetical protein
MSPKKMIGLSFTASAAKGYEVFDKLTKRRGDAPALLRITYKYKIAKNCLEFLAI